MPVVEPTVAATVLELVHVPPGMALLSAEVKPRHTFVLPVIRAIGLTVTAAVVIQPVGSV